MYIAKCTKHLKSAVDVQLYIPKCTEHLGTAVDVHRGNWSAGKLIQRKEVNCPKELEGFSADHAQVSQN